MPILTPPMVRGTMRCMRPEFWHLSPAVGLALSAGGSHVLGRLYGLEPPNLSDGTRVQMADGRSERWKGSAACRLVRELYHRVHHDEPLRATANRSLPGAHLSPSLAAVVVGLTDARAASGAPGGATVPPSPCHTFRTSSTA